jgi:sugar phosphate isomerase/epimerase
MSTNKHLTFILSLGLLVFSQRSSFAQQGSPLYTAPLGVQAYTFRKSFPINVTRTLDTIRTMGFSEMEGGSNGMNPTDFRKLCDARGISIPSVGAGYEQLMKSPDSVVRTAKILGAGYVMCAWIPHDRGVLTFENARKAVEDFNRVGKYLKEQGLVFCYHAHGYEFQPYAKGTLLDYIITNTNPDWVSFEMDIFWIQFGGGDPVSLMKKYGKRWKLMHLKDLKKGAKKDLTGLTSPENDVPLGTGELDIPAILSQAALIDIAHYFIEDESDHVNEQVPQSILYLKSLTVH